MSFYITRKDENENFSFIKIQKSELNFYELR